MKKLTLKKYLVIAFILLNINKTIGQEQIEKNKEERKSYISIRPQSYLFGANIGYETSISKKWSLKTDFTSHFHSTIPKNIAISPTIKWYYQDEVGKGFHLNLKTFGGYFFNETCIKNSPYYAGGGAGIGYTSNFKNSKLGISVNANLKVPYVFGNRPNSTNNDVDTTDGGVFNMIYMYYLSPANALDLNIGVTYKL